MLGLPMGGQGTRRQFYVALGTADPLVELLPVCVCPPRHLEGVGIRRVTPKRVARMTIYAYYLGHISTVFHAIEEFRQRIEGPL